MDNLIDKAYKIHELSNSEICSILSENDTEYLTKKADETRENYIGNLVKFVGLIQISNICGQNCLYCENRKDNNELQRYAYSDNDIVNTVKSISKDGIKRVLLQAGESSSLSVQQLSDTIRRLKIFNFNPIVSIGERNITEYEMLNEAGAEQIFVNLKTSSFTLFEELHPDMPLMGRMACLRVLKKHGIKTGTGLIIGFPNQTNSSIADDILFLKSINVDSVEFMPFVPEMNTPLKDETPVSFEKIVKVIAITRLLMPTADIYVSEKINLIQPNGNISVLKSGANMIVENLTDKNGNITDFDFNLIKKEVSSSGRNLL